MLSEKLAIRRSYSDDRSGERKTLATYVMNRGKCYAILCETDSSRFDQLQEIFDKAADSFRFE